ncbi:MAG: ComF family protein, partial [Candidatus Methylomirabilales bacterium]
MQAVAWSRGWAQLQATLLQFFCPGSCHVCHRPLGQGSGGVICGPCWQTIQPIGAVACAKCGGPFPAAAAVSHSPSHRCQACRTRRRHFLLARAACRYEREGALRAALLLMKHGRREAFARPLASLMIEEAGRTLPLDDLDAIVAVPLHRKRLRERGFNQSELLARELSRRLGLPYLSRAILRERPTPPQSGRRKERERNVRGAFRVP